MFLLPGGSEKALVDAINQANVSLTPLAPGDLYFGKITYHNPKDGSVDVPAVAVIGSQFEGYIKLNYDRLNLGKAYGTIKPKVRRPGYPTLHRLLPAINEVLGLSLTPDDVADVPITWLAENEQVNIPIVAKPSSLGFEGQFLVEYTRVRHNLADLAVKDLTALKHPIEPSLGKRSLAMATWSLDFTDDQKSLSLSQGQWSNPSAVVDLMALYGFDNWPQAEPKALKVQATKDVPRANQKYTSVIIQKDVSIGDFVGDAYFHYNR